jgi:kinesin family protein 2/24
MVNIVGLQRRQVQDVQSLMQIISFGMSVRTTGVTGANDDSSRSHGVLEIEIKDGTKTLGKMSFIDLAGSERGADVTDSDKQTR